MPRSRIKFFLALSAVILLTGCASGYRDRLGEYQQNAPTPFDSQTLAWLDKADQPTTGTIPEALAPTLVSTHAMASTPEVALDLIARVTGLPPEQLAPRLDALNQPGTVRNLLENTLNWEVLAVAVAVANPAVRSARESWLATLRQYSQADYLETLVGQYRTFTRTLDVNAGEPMNKAMTLQFFPYPGTIALKGELIRRQAEIARLDWEKTLRDTLIEAGQTFFTYQYLHRAEATTRDNVELVRDLTGVVEQQYRAGSASQADLIKVQTELERQLNILEDIQARIQSNAASLASLLNLPTDSMQVGPEDKDLPQPILPIDELTSQALTMRQEVAIQKTKVARAGLAIRLGEAMNQPLASRGYSNFERGAQPDASVGSSAPSFGLMAKAKDRPAYAQAEAFLSEMRIKLQAAESMLAQTQAQTRALAQTWFQELDIARREERLLREIVLPQSQSAYDASRSDYASGGISFLDILDAERRLITARQELDTARQELNQVLVRSAQVTGHLPEFSKED